MKIRLLVALPALAALLFAGTALATDLPYRTFDKLSVAEMDAISKVTHEYYMSVSNKISTITGADASSPLRIMATYPERIKIIRQQSRIRLLNVEKILYAMHLNPEFITNYVNTLREDVVYFALDQVLRKAAGEKADPGSSETLQNEKTEDAHKTDTGKPGAGIFSPPAAIREAVRNATK